MQILNEQKRHLAPLEASDTRYAGAKEQCTHTRRTAGQVMSTGKSKRGKRKIREDEEGILTVIDHEFQTAPWKSLWSWRVVVDEVD